MQHGTKPDHAVTVFAGQDREATEKARGYFGGHPPTSPAIAILRDGQLVYLMQRSAIETSTAPAIAQELARAFDSVLREGFGLSKSVHGQDGQRTDKSGCLPRASALFLCVG